MLYFEFRLPDRFNSTVLWKKFFNFVLRGILHFAKKQFNKPAVMLDFERDHAKKFAKITNIDTIYT